MLDFKKKRSHINKLIVNDGIQIDNQEEIMKEIKRFYTDLLSEYNEETSASVGGNDEFYVHIPRLSTDNKQFCEGKISPGESHSILKEMKLNKSPGNDGLTVEFYLMFWPVIVDFVLDSFNASFEIGKLSSSQRQGVITLIEKEGKD